MSEHMRWTEVHQAALAELDRVRASASRVTSWLKSDIDPSSLPPEYGSVKAELFERIGEIKDLVDRAKDVLAEADRSGAAPGSEGSNG